MKTIDEAAKESAKKAWSNYENPSEHNIIGSEMDFKAGAKFAQQWISVEEEEHPPITEICDSDGKLHYSAYVLLKVKTLQYPVVGYYCFFDDDQLFDVIGEDEVKQEDITHWRLIEIK